jgi:hypothetical protein
MPATAWQVSGPVHVPVATVPEPQHGWPMPPQVAQVDALAPTPGMQRSPALAQKSGAGATPGQQV